MRNALAALGLVALLAAGGVAHAQPPTDTGVATQVAPVRTPPREAPSPAVTARPLRQRARIFAFLSGGLAGSFANDSAMWPSFGGGLGGEFLLHPYFAAGLEGRFTSWKPSEGEYLDARGRSIDISLVPRGILALGSFELYVAAPFGPTLDWLPDLVGARAGAGIGFHFAPVLGMRVFGDALGWTLQAGYAWHWGSVDVPLGDGREGTVEVQRSEVIVDTGIAVRFF